MNQVKRFRFAPPIIVLALAGLFIAGCSSDGAKTDSTKTTETKSIESVTAELKADKTTASASEAISYTLIIKNNSDATVDGYKINFVNPTGLDTAMKQEGGSKPSFDQSTNSWNWESGKISANGSFWLSFTETVLPNTPAGVDIQAQFTVNGGSLTKPVSSNTVAVAVKE